MFVRTISGCGSPGEWIRQRNRSDLIGFYRILIGSFKIGSDGIQQSDCSSWVGEGAVCACVWMRIKDECKTHASTTPEILTIWSRFWSGFLFFELFTAIRIHFGNALVQTLPTILDCHEIFWRQVYRSLWKDRVWMTDKWKSLIHSSTYTLYLTFRFSFKLLPRKKTH
jgi:hypothetical protein